ncbi:hypothetical protein [Bradyrhizobium liaoningense]|uniref:hypothetical protein n=1 Tax=Bradyrhizobium liaoningense TaxID=43992 RepID=UPI001BA7CECA|nr:hypothetical protein [Bradyrhizobium liaoningense]MBR0717865.1 hypothetical protein [Bradyrhizobium liaoningense]
MKMVMRPTVKIKQPPAFGKGEPWKALNFRWREAGGKEHVVALATGANVSDVESVKFWWDKRNEVTKFAVYCAATGQDLAEFYVVSLDHKMHLGSGILPAGATPDDVTHFFTALRKRGVDGVITPSLECSELLFHFPESGLQMPGAGPRGLELHMVNFASGATDILHIAPHSKLPQHFADLYHAKRADYERILRAHRPRVFMVYDLADRIPTPTQICELGRDRKYHSIGEIADGDDGGGFVARAHGMFGRTLTAHDLAWIACKLAVKQQWLVLIKRTDEELDADTVLLMSAFAPHEFVSATTEIPISLMIGG